MQQVVGDLAAQRGDRLPVMPRGPYRATRAGGIAQTPRAGIFVAGRLVRRGKTAPLAHQEHIRRNAKCPVIVKSPPAPPLVLLQSQLLFELLIIPLDDPAVLSEGEELFELRLGGQIRQPVLGRFRFPLGPFDQQPLLGMSFVLLVVAMRRTHP